MFFHNFAIKTVVIKHNKNQLCCKMKENKYKVVEIIEDSAPPYLSGSCKCQITNTRLVENIKQSKTYCCLCVKYNYLFLQIVGIGVLVCLYFYIFVSCYTCSFMLIWCNNEIYALFSILFTVAIYAKFINNLILSIATYDFLVR